MRVDKSAMLCDRAARSVMTPSIEPPYGEHCGVEISG